MPTSLPGSIPFPSEPEIAKEDAKLFRELFSLRRSQAVLDAQERASVKAPRRQRRKTAGSEVEVISRKIVGEFDIAVVRETGTQAD